MEEILISEMTSTLHQGICEVFKIRTWSNFLKHLLLYVEGPKMLIAGIYVRVQPLTNKMGVLNAQNNFLNYIERIKARHGLKLLYWRS